ncbi:pirin family protein [Nocardia puris]|uniref:pirin family protein n=1 Tax=Nocardia puris TaxID=208602 RepID=UPI00189441F3|nr:pirin family protein [Nocardia puris]MBF6210288.1 pirin family protein [Nocardia puris]MBF6367364.1 pirin family protein [Nocardia puris]MBF6457549.1 pirin family protein [Nocardia puris]
MTPTPRVRVVRADERAHWWNEWLDSRQSFPATGNFDLAANAHGLLLVHNEDVVGPGEGFDTHQHRDMEIVTWVLEGSVVHQDSAGNSGVIHPGLAQRMSAGTGIRHSEKNGAAYTEREHLRVVQMWVPPTEYGARPGYQESDVDTALRGDALVPIASGLPRDRATTAITLGNRHAALHVARLDAGRSVTIPDAPYGHVFLARGAVDFEGHGALAQGDAVRLTASGGHRVTAIEPAEVLVWEMHAAA